MSRRVKRVGSNRKIERNMGEEWRVPFPTWSTFNISDSIEGVMARARPTMEKYGEQVHGKGFKIYRWLVPRRLSRIEALPDEVLVEIFNALGWREVLHLRQTCKRLHELSKDKTVWLSQLTKLSLVLPVSPRLEDHRDLYTSQEIEDFVLYRISADVGWLSGQKPRSRGMPPWPKFQDPTFALVEGGRWLLIADEGLVYAQDLNAPSIREPELIISGQSQYKESLYCLRVDVDRTEPILTFNLSILPLRNRTGPSTLQIYRVQATGHGSDARLVAKPLKHLSLTIEGRSEQQDLAGNYFARSFFPYDQPAFLEVYDWNLSNQTTRYMATLKLRATPKALVILPESRILSYESDTVIIYNMGTIIQVTDGAVDLASTMDKVWKYGPLSYSSEYRHASRPLCGPFSTKITVSDGTRVFGINIPHSGATPSVHLLFKDTPAMLILARLGINKVYFQGHYKSCTVNLSWPDEDRTPSVPLPHKSFHVQSWPFKLIGDPVFDEGSGRIASFTTKHGWKILEFDLYHRNE